MRKDKKKLSLYKFKIAKLTGEIYTIIGGKNIPKETTTSVYCIKNKSTQTKGPIEDSSLECLPPPPADLFR